MFNLILSFIAGAVLALAWVVAIAHHNRKAKPDTGVFECLLAGCRHHDGKFMGCSLKAIEINPDGICSQIDMLNDDEMRAKIESVGGLSNV